MGGVARIVAGAYGAGGIGEGVAGAINGIFGLTSDLIGGLQDPELIALTVTSYTAQDLALLTLAGQMGLTPDELRAAGIESLTNKPLFEMVFKVLIMTSRKRPNPQRWFGRVITKRVASVRAPDAQEIGCIRINSCAYRGRAPTKLIIQSDIFGGTTKCFTALFSS